MSRQHFYLLLFFFFCNVKLLTIVWKCVNCSELHQIIIFFFSLLMFIFQFQNNLPKKNWIIATLFRWKIVSIARDVYNRYVPAFAKRWDKKYDIGIPWQSWMLLPWRKYSIEIKKDQDKRTKRTATISTQKFIRKVKILLYYFGIPRCVTHGWRTWQLLSQHIWKLSSSVRHFFFLK